MLSGAEESCLALQTEQGLEEALAWRGQREGERARACNRFGGFLTARGQSAQLFWAGGSLL